MTKLSKALPFIKLIILVQTINSTKMNDLTIIRCQRACLKINYGFPLQGTRASPSGAIGVEAQDPVAHNL